MLNKKWKLAESKFVSALSEYVGLSLQGLSRHLCPLYVNKEPNGVQLVGTGTRVRVGGDYFIFTAAHVLGSVGPQSLFGAGPGSKHPVRLSGRRIVSASSSNEGSSDTIDMGIIVLRREEITLLGENAFMSEDCLDANDTGMEDALYLAVGFPQAKNEATRGLPMSRSIDAHLTQLGPVGLFKKPPFSRDIHLFVRFKKNSVVLDNRKTTASDPYGLSGGPLIRVDLESPERWKLVGTLIEWNKPHAGLVAVRVKQHLHAVSQLGTSH